MIDRLFHTVVLVAVAMLAVLAAGGLGGRGVDSAPTPAVRMASPTVTLERVVITAERPADGRRVAATDTRDTTDPSAAAGTAGPAARTVQ